MPKRISLKVACCAAIAAAVLSAIVLYIEATSLQGPGAWKKDLTDIVTILVASPIVMFLLVLWACAYYDRRNR